MQDDEEEEVVLSVAELEGLPPVKGMGGKIACQWQRQLREKCIAAEVSDKDLTDDPLYNWKQLLRSAAPGFARRIIGPGLVRVLFRILESERDHNYSNTDGHGRHVFEFRRTDGSLMRLHYHKNGRADEPTYVGPQAVVLPGLQQPAGGAAQPAGLAAVAAARIIMQDDLRNAALSRTPVGRDEASAALQTLVHYYHGEVAPGAVDITEGSGFDWLRWVAMLEGARGVIRDGVYRVYAVRWAPGGVAEAVFCYSCGHFAQLPPRSARYTGANASTRLVMNWESNWQTEPLLSAAPVASRSWLVLRDAVSWESA